jgi:hypothetical protein
VLHSGRLSNIRPDWKSFPGTNASAYYVFTIETKVFISPTAGGGNDDDGGGSPDSPTNPNNGGRLISGVPSPSRASLASGPGSKYAVRDFSHSVDGVNLVTVPDRKNLLFASLKPREIS